MPIVRLHTTDSMRAQGKDSRIHAATASERVGRRARTTFSPPLSKISGLLLSLGQLKFCAWLACEMAKEVFYLPPMGVGGDVNSTRLLGLGPGRGMVRDDHTT